MKALAYTHIFARVSASPIDVKYVHIFVDADVYGKGMSSMSYADSGYSMWTHACYGVHLTGDGQPSCTILHLS